ncbi:enoyl-CoA hydratase-related protein [Hirschia litorea]|uniref:Enoyl-CoA hydratase-related protein n=1 Tax=Hirschia litorea TaxID=1199156 RepID=A0ABW2IN23_9PROT
MSYKLIETNLDEVTGVASIVLNRPEQRNALSSELMTELSEAIEHFEGLPVVGCIVISGKGGKAFAGGADIKEMAGRTYSQNYKDNFITANWERVAQCRKPTIAAVSGYALGGGCELAMMCDIIVAGENAKFGQPEINLALLPGAGGTQRLTRFIGKSTAMDMCLTGRMLTAAEALSLGLVSRVVPTDELMDLALDMAKTIASKSRMTAMMVKEAVNTAYETSLSQGVLFERRAFHSVFATGDAKEGMTAFTENRPPRWDNK